MLCQISLMRLEEFVKKNLKLKMGSTQLKNVSKNWLGSLIIIRNEESQQLALWRHITINIRTNPRESNENEKRPLFGFNSFEFSKSDVR